MNRRGTIALLIAASAPAGCAVATKGVEVRPIADPVAALARGGDALAAARGQLALGNVGLALEAFRKVQRDRPSDLGPLAGIGDCYAAMGRLDLAQSSYEAALALAPKNPALLAGLAQVLEREGQHGRAIALRVEAAVVAMPITLAPAAVSAPASSATGIAKFAADKQVLASSSITVSLPPARPVAEHNADTPAASPAASAAAAPAARSTLAASSVSKSPPPARAVAPLQADAAAAVPHKPAMALAASSSTVTVALPPARPAPAKVSVAAASESATPHLERLSSGEVALVTTEKPLWRANLNARTASSSTLRWVPLAPAGARPNVQVLNAARVRGLAASGRTVLIDRGWRKIAIGDAPRVQQKSIVLYPKERAALARSLAAQFGIDSRMVEGDVLVLVLGRDRADVIKGKRA
jgi:hypothetical protein